MSTVVELHDGQLRVRALGPPDAPAVLALHGVGSSTTYLAEAVAPPLVTAGWRVLLVPLRGHVGATAVPDPAAHALDRHVDDVARVAAATGPVAAVGVSLGAHALVAAAARGRLDVEALVAALPAWTGRAVPGEGPHAATAAEVDAHGVAGMLARLRGEPGLRPWLRRVLLRDLAAHHDASLRAALVALDGGLAPTLADLAALRCRLGVVGWADDPGHPLAVARQWASAAPDGSLAELSLDDPDVDRTALGQVVATLLGPPADVVSRRA